MVSSSTSSISSSSPAKWVCISFCFTYKRASILIVNNDKTSTYTSLLGIGINAKPVYPKKGLPRPHHAVIVHNCKPKSCSEI